MLIKYVFVVYEVEEGSSGQMSGAWKWHSFISSCNILGALPWLLRFTVCMIDSGACWRFERGLALVSCTDALGVLG